MDDDNQDAIRSTLAQMNALQLRLLDVAFKGKVSANVKAEMLMRCGDMYAFISKIKTE